MVVVRMAAMEVTMVLFESALSVGLAMSQKSMLTMLTTQMVP